MTNKSVYVVVDCLSGEDYGPVDDPFILLVTSNYEEAVEFFTEEKLNWEKGFKNFDSKTTKSKGETKLEYECTCTDFENWSHRVMKIIKAQVREEELKRISR